MGSDSLLVRQNSQDACQPIIRLKQIYKSFRKDKEQELLVLENINFSMMPNEIVALLGKSGSGKSTLLRIAAGLIPPTQGKVYYRDRLVTGPVKGISMVFQNFALLPWLTVLQNVELGLESLGVSRNERRSRALKAIDTIGLDGFESAFPKELSGGMRQRVGFARALVVEPDVLLMDEPFSALDVLTADNLKSDLLALWNAKKTRTNGILFVTHNIEEAVELADRIIIVDSNPGRICEEVKVGIPHPRYERAEYPRMIDDIYTLMTRKPKEIKPKLYAMLPEKEIGLSYRLPDADVSVLTGLLESLVDNESKGKMDLPELAELLHLDVDNLFPLIEVLEVLHFSRVSEGDIVLTLEGREFADAGIQKRKKIFSVHLVKYVPLARYIRQVLDDRARHRVSEDYFLAELNHYFSDRESERVLKVAIDWGRYAELFAYDFNSGELSLENPN